MKSLWPSTASIQHTLSSGIEFKWAVRVSIPDTKIMEPLRLDGVEIDSHIALTDESPRVGGGLTALRWEHNHNSCTSVGNVMSAATYT